MSFVYNSYQQPHQQLCFLPSCNALACTKTAGKNLGMGPVEGQLLWYPRKNGELHERGWLHMPRITGHQPISGLGCLGQKKKDLTHAQLAPGKVGDFAPAKGVARGWSPMDLWGRHPQKCVQEWRVHCQQSEAIDWKHERTRRYKKHFDFLPGSNIK